MMVMCMRWVRMMMMCMKEVMWMLKEVVGKTVQILISWRKGLRGLILMMMFLGI